MRDSVANNVVAAASAPALLDSFHVKTARVPVATAAAADAMALKATQPQLIANTRGMVLKGRDYRRGTFATMPLHEEGETYAVAFIVEPERCWRVVHDPRGQAGTCYQATTWTGRWHSPRNDGTWWRVWSCERHRDGLTALRRYR